MKDFYKDKNKRLRYNYKRSCIVVRVKSIMNYYAESYNVAKSLISRHCVEEILNAKLNEFFRMLRQLSKQIEAYTFKQFYH